MIKTKTILFSIFAIIACSSCDDAVEEYFVDGKYKLPIKIKIIDEEDVVATRLAFNGSEGQGQGKGSARKLEWSDNDEIAFYSSAWGNTKYLFKTSVDNGTTSLFGDVPLPFAASTTITLQSLYPHSRLTGMSGTSLEATLPKVQNATVEPADYDEPKKFPPEGQETGGFKCYNITDYSSCLLYASTSITTNGSKEITGSPTLQYRVRVAAFDVIIDAPKTGSATIDEIDVQVGTLSGGEFKPHTTKFLTGTLSNVDNSTPSVKKDGNESNEIQLKFTPVTITGTNRIVARLYTYRGTIQNGTVFKITTKCSKYNNDAGKSKTFYRIITLGTQTNDNVITHFYLGQLPIYAESVDLGLPSGTLWAKDNIGVTETNSVGDYFAWAADKSISPFTYNTYKQFPTKTTETKLTGTTAGYYNNPASISGTSISGTNYDIAHLELGGKWHMPNQEDWDELVKKCTWTWDGTKHGYTVTSNMPGYTDKSIFLPAEGYMDGETKTDDGSGYYWTSIRDNESTPSNRRSYGFKVTGTSTITTNYDTRYYRHLGMLIRPVYK